MGPSERTRYILATACDSIHPATASPQAKHITWTPRPDGMDRARVTQWTCADCRKTWYELVQAGGLLYIRRLSASQDMWTRGMVHAEAITLWGELLNGQAR